MEAVLLRTGSISVHSQLLTSSPKPSLSLSCDLFSVTSTKLSTHSDTKPRRIDVSARCIRRVLSDSDLNGSETELSLSRLRSQSFSTRIPEEEYVTEGDPDDGRSSVLLRNLLDDSNFAGEWHGSAVSVEEVAVSGGGFGKGRKAGGGDDGSDDFAGGDCDRSNIGDYYQHMLKSNPGDSLLLRNYAKYLHEVEKDLVRAEEYYGRAILANPGDGELLSLYGNLIWETQRDENRARSYFDQAVHASPDDCTVLGSYARFMWEAEEDEEDEEYIGSEIKVSPAMVAAV